jgi:hypothetical protein
MCAVFWLTSATRAYVGPTNILLKHRVFPDDDKRRIVKARVLHHSHKIKQKPALTIAMKLIKAKLEQIAENIKSTKKQYSNLASELVEKTTLVMKRADGNKKVVSNDLSDHNDGEVTIDFYSTAWNDDESERTIWA